MHGVLRLAQLRSTRWFSSASTFTKLALTQQNRVTFQAGDAMRTDLVIVPVVISDDFALSISDKTTDVHNLVTIKQDNAALHIVKHSVSDCKLELRLPQTVSLNVTVANGSVTLKDKMEGDIKVVMGRGDIKVDKVRGSDVSFKTNGGQIHVFTLMEGETVRLEASESINCKRLMARKAEVRLGNGEALSSSFGAIYAETCNIMSANQSGQSKLCVGNVHGYLRVSSEGLDSIEIGSVSGTLEMEDSGPACRVNAHFDSWTNEASSSVLVSGDVRVSLEPAAAINVELHGKEITISKDCVFTSSEREQLEEDFAVFTGKLCAQEKAILASSDSTGKINVKCAKEDAMRTSFFMKDSVADDTKDDKTPRLLVHSLRGNVMLDQLNWMDNIKRHLKQ
ncbi:hypothetical protein CCR75_009642 [Bremia lactucae]|uniref:DUF4097 domain-containing protein n=1 Tax=Bremia lactucae TaxID=4779 RepID=A0A976FIQ4_BRELC|nr:hypothetical protein CCR75_009642 [Bremia lactucae]